MTDIKTGLNTNLDLFKGIVRYTDKAGVQHVMETAANLSSIAEVRSALNNIKTNLIAKGFTVNDADVVDVLNDIVGGTNSSTDALGEAWRSYRSPLGTNAANKLTAYCAYKNADGTFGTKLSSPCSSRAEALTELNTMITNLNSIGAHVLNTCITDDTTFGGNLTDIFGDYTAWKD